MVKHQEMIDTFFGGQAPVWDSIYSGTDVNSIVHQHRQRMALRHVERLDLRPDSRALDVGCGAGHYSVTLARAGLLVDGVDTAGEMLDSARRNVESSGLRSRITLARADAQALPFADDHFDLVLAIGILPWVEDPTRAVREMARVLKPGAHVVVSADNSAWVIYFIDPLRNPLLTPLRARAKRYLERGGVRRFDPRAKQLWPSQIRPLLHAASLEVIEHKTFGFGPVTLFGKHVLPERAGHRINSALQAFADHGIPPIRSMGAQHLILARKPVQSVQ